MPTRIRLKRVGAKKNPHYRIVVMDGSKPRDGAAIEELGYYDPRTPQATAVFHDEDRALYWLLTGAQPSETARSLLRKAGIWAKFAAARDPYGKPTETAPADEATGPDEAPAAEGAIVAQGAEEAPSQE